MTFCNRLGICQNVLIQNIDEVSIESLQLPSILATKSCHGVVECVACSIENIKTEARSKLEVFCNVERQSCCAEKTIGEILVYAFFGFRHRVNGKTTIVQWIIIVRIVVVHGYRRIQAQCRNDDTTRTTAIGRYIVGGGTRKRPTVAQCSLTVK